MVLSRLLLKLLDKMDFSKVRKRFKRNSKVKLKKPKILGEKPRSGNTAARFHY